MNWDYLRDLHKMIDLPWMMAGDFNEILQSSEKEGGAPRPQWCMQAFSTTLDDCNLDDLGFNADLFTWRRGQIRERLGRATSNVAWDDLFPKYGISPQPFDKSDHCLMPAES